MSQALGVEQEELFIRARELEEPIAGQPTENPQPACALKVAINAAKRLGVSADVMREYLDRGQRERSRLAQSLRNAARSYSCVDDDASQVLNQTVNDGDSVLSPAARTVAAEEAEGPESAGASDTQSLAGGDNLDFTALKKAAIEIEQDDQAASLLRGAEEWAAYQQALLDSTRRFRPFENWTGDAADAVEAEFDLHRTWMFDMADWCGKLAEQFQEVASVQRWAFPDPSYNRTVNHPTSYDVYWSERDWAQYHNDPRYRDHVLRVYWGYVQRSQEVLAEYAKRTSSLTPVRPPKPPTASKIAPPPDRNPDADPKPDPGDNKPNPSGPNPNDGSGPGENLPGSIAMPSTPFAAAPAIADQAAPTGDVFAGTPAPAPAGVGGVKPASLGGYPSMPLQSPVATDSASQTASPVRPGALSGATPGATGGGMGMAPMGAPGGKGAGKAKRAHAEDEPVYTEDRAWSEGVVGVVPVRKSKVAADK
jgi:hypothetical protein